MLGFGHGYGVYGICITGAWELHTYGWGNASYWKIPGRSIYLSLGLLDDSVGFRAFMALAYGRYHYCFSILILEVQIYLLYIHTIRSTGSIITVTNTKLHMRSCLAGDLL